MRGEENGRATIKEADVLEIRRLFKQGSFTQAQLAQKYNLAKITINRIIRKALWKHV